MSSLSHDVVIAGGGMIGMSLALALAPLGLKIAVVEAVGRETDLQPSFDERSTALSRSTQRAYEAMGLWPQIVAASTPIKRVHVSDKGHFGFSHIDATEQKVEALGYVVINRILGNVLQSALPDCANIEFLCPARTVAVDLSDSEANIVIDNGKQSSLTCRLFVAADGANSSTRTMIGISASRKNYGQRAIVGNIVTEKPLDNCAYERFTESGPLALLPMTEGRCGFVWTVADRNADHLLSLSNEDFLGELQQAFGLRVGEFSRLGARVAYPLTLSKAARLTAKRAVLVGNAAHGLHPVAAQGFNLGMRDVAALCDCIAEAAEPGDVAMLDAYADWRKSDQGKLVRFTDGIVRLFGEQQPPVRALRRIGMIGFDLVPGARRLFAKHTMGLAGRLPRLSRGVPLT